MEHLLVYDYCLRSFHRDQHIIVDAHSDNFRIDVTLFLLSHNILICGAVGLCYGQAYQRLLIKLIKVGAYTSMGLCLCLSVV